ncbi:hypothetical protein JXA80_11800 [bacterium]|nr:hypothetical protein [candidate division CSSED10-310 bacterium]
MKRTQSSLSEIQEVATQLPAVVFSTPESRQANKLIEVLGELGAEADILADDGRTYEKQSPPFDIREKAHEEAGEWTEQSKEKPHRASWLIVLLAMLPFLIRAIPERLPDMDTLRDAVRSVISPVSPSFDRVQVIVAAQAITAGHVITLADIRIEVISRESAPPNAVAPLNVDRILGKPCKRDVARGKIIPADPCL